MKVKSVLVSQPRPAVIEKSPFYELSQKHHVEIAYRPFIRVEGVSLKEFRAQRVEILTHTAVIFTSRTTVDSFFHICEEARITVPETMKYICQTEAVALYLQKYIVYRKRKISFADGSFTSLIELIIKHKEEKFLLALSEPHKPELPETLAKLKLSFDPVILARTVAGDLDDVKMADYDLLALYSPSDVKTLIEKFGTDGLPAEAEPLAQLGKHAVDVLQPAAEQGGLGAGAVGVLARLGAQLHHLALLHDQGTLAVGHGHDGAVGDDVLTAVLVGGTAVRALLAFDGQHIRREGVAVKIFLPLVGHHAGSCADGCFYKTHKPNLLCCGINSLSHGIRRASSLKEGA